MSFERSHGKLRPGLPRLAELGSGDDTARSRTAGRDASGRFVPGNRVSVRSGDKAAVKALLGEGAGDGAAGAVARDAARIARALVGDMPNDRPAVRLLCTLAGRAAALAGWLTGEAEKAGLGTPAGLDLVDRATAQGQRAERLLVSALGTAKAVGGARDDDGPTPTALAALAAINAENARHASTSDENDTTQGTDR